MDNYETLLVIKIDTQWKVNLDTHSKVSQLLVMCLSRDLYNSQ